MNYFNSNSEIFPLHNYGPYNRLTMNQFNSDVNLIRNTMKNAEFMNKCNQLYTKREILNSMPLQSLDNVSPDYRPVMQHIDQELWNIASALCIDSKFNCFGTLLGVLSSVLAATQGTYRIHIGFSNWYEAAVLQILEFAPSGFMKSAVCERILCPFKDFQKIKQDEFANNNNPRKIYIANQIRKNTLRELIKDYDFDNIPDIDEIILKEDHFNDSLAITNNRAMPKIISTPATYCGMLKELKDQNESIFFVSSEAHQLMSLLDKENYGLILKGYGYEDESRKTATSDINLSNPAVSILGFAQPEIAKKIYLKANLNNIGVLSRFIPIIHTEGVNDHPILIKKQLVQEYRRKIGEILAINYRRDGKIIKSIPVDMDGVRLLETFRQANNSEKNNKDEKYNLWLAKLHGQAARLAFAIHVWNNHCEPLRSPISKHEVEQAILIAKNCKHSAKFLFSPLGFKAMEDAKRIVEHFRRITDPNDLNHFYSHGTCVTYIQQRLRIQRVDIYPALEYLAARNWLTYIDDGSGNWPVLPHKDFYGINWA